VWDFSEEGLYEKFYSHPKNFHQNSVSRNPFCEEISQVLKLKCIFFEKKEIKFLAPLPLHPLLRKILVFPW
jgi:hypothetical protein